VAFLQQNAYRWGKMNVGLIVINLLCIINSVLFRGITADQQSNSSEQSKKIWLEGKSNEKNSKMAWGGGGFQ
jgi:hypothetical protein